MIALGVITSSNQATPDLIDEYEVKYEESNISSTDMEIM